jgi:hypothetical protein
VTPLPVIAFEISLGLTSSSESPVAKLLEIF